MKLDDIQETRLIEDDAYNEASKVITLYPKDLTIEGRRKNIEDIRYYDIKDSLATFKHANIVIFIDEDKYQMKILKNRYKLVL